MRLCAILQLVKSVSLRYNDIAAENANHIYKMENNMAIIRSGRIHFYAQNGVTCYILRGERGDLLIDTGVAGIWAGLRRWLRSYQVRHVLLTHAHTDHDWNAARLQRRSAQILLSANDRNLIRDFQAQPVRAVFPSEKTRVALQKIGTSLIKSAPYTPDYDILESDRDLLRTLGYDAEIVPLPGHTLGSVGVISGDVLYCGDAFTMLHGVPEIPPTAVSPELLAESLRRILAMRVRWLACGHGLPVRMRDARPVIEGFLNRKEN